MAYDDDEQRSAYHRALNYEFFNIVQHFDDTARPAHDDIDYQSPDYDGAEFDGDGQYVAPIGDINDILATIADLIAEYDSFEDIPDDLHIIQVDIADDDIPFIDDYANDPEPRGFFYNGPIFFHFLRKPKPE